jgi:hypothetical protein
MSILELIKMEKDIKERLSMYLTFDSFYQEKEFNRLSLVQKEKFMINSRKYIK